MDSSKQFLCEECGLSFTLNKNPLRHVREKHQGKKRTDNEKRKAVNEKRKREVLAEKILLSKTDIKEVVLKSYPAEAICFHFVRKTPWTEDMKRKAEESFEEIFRACDQTFVFVEYESTEENVPDEARLVVTEKLVSQLELYDLL